MSTTAIVPNFHVITVTFLGATDYKGSRVKMTSERFEDSKTIGYNHEFSNTYEVAINYLVLNGFNIIGKAEGKNCYYIITDTFKGLKA